MIFVKWLLLFFPALFIEFLCYATNWFVCLFVRHEIRTDRVKRMGNQQVTMMREYPIKLFTLWSTHDNALDEYWWGLFGDEKWTIEEYKASWWKRYISRVRWLYRNNAYGWLYTCFSQPVEPLLKQYTKGVDGDAYWYNVEIYKSSFLIEGYLPFNKFFPIALLLYTVAIYYFELTLIWAPLVLILFFLAINKTRYFTVKFGWKGHKGFPKKMYANRIPPFGIRKYEKEE
jgi:hypothetical protein